MLDGDLNRLKVAELRDELLARGLDTKGVKAVLVKRLRSALNKEAKEQNVSSNSPTNDVNETTGEEQEESCSDGAIENNPSVDPEDEPLNDACDQPLIESVPDEEHDVNQEDEIVENEPVNIETTPKHDESHLSEKSSAEAVVEPSVLNKTSVEDIMQEEPPCHMKENQLSENLENQDCVNEEISKSHREAVTANMECQPVEETKQDDSFNLSQPDTSGIVQENVADSSVMLEQKQSEATATLQNSGSEISSGINDSNMVSVVLPASESTAMEQEANSKNAENCSDAPEISTEEKVGIPETHGTKRKRPEENETSIKEEVLKVPIKTERRTGGERRTRWDTMKVEKDEFDDTSVTLDTYNSDLNLVIDASRYSAYPLTDAGFAFMWAGARATHGVQKGKTCFEVMVRKHLDVSHLPEDEPNPHVVRVGYSVEDSTLQLGEDPLSYGYGGTGKISTNCQFRDYGTSFQEGDCVTAFLNYDSDPVEIGFAKNGRFAGWAYKVAKSQFHGKALFPHVLTKNTSFETNFGQMDKPFYSLPDGFSDYVFIGCISPDLKIRGTKAPERREDCEMIMMCGLPGAGKSVWAAEYAQKNPNKKYNVLGTNNIIDKMKVMGLPRKRNYHGRWDVLIQMATKCLNKLFEIGSKLRRNYILDQTNVYPTAQRRKMRNFEGFRRSAVVVVPTDEEYRRRCDKRDREEGKEIPDHAVLEMKANFKLPDVCDIFDDVIFTELQRDEAEKLVRMYNEEGRAAVGPPGKRFKPKEEQSSPIMSNASPNQGPPNRGARNAGGFDRDRRGRAGGFNNGPPRNWNEGPQGGFGGGHPNSRGGFGGPRGFGGGGFEGNRGGRGGFDGGSRGGFDGGSRGGFDGGSRGGRGGFDGSPGSRGGRGGFNSGSPGMRGGRGGYDGPGGGRGGRGGYGGGSPAGFGSRSPSGYGDYGSYGSGDGSPGYGDHSPGGYGGGYGRGAPRGSFPRGGASGPRGPPPPPSGYGGYNEGDSYGGGYNDYREGGYGNDYGNDSGYSGGGRGGFGGSSGPPSSFRKEGGFGRGGRGTSGNSRGNYSPGNRGGSFGSSSGSGYRTSSYSSSGESSYTSPSSSGYSSANAGASGNYPGSSGGASGYGNSSSGGSSGGYSGNMGRGGVGRGMPRGGGSTSRGYSGPPPPQTRGGVVPRGRGAPVSGRGWPETDHSQSTMGVQSQVSSYSTYGSAPAKSGSESVSSSYSSYDPGYSSGYESSSQGGYQTYGYQATSQAAPAPAAAAAPTQWTDPAPTSTPMAAAAPPVAVTQPTPEQIQQQWTQYYQQQSQQQQQYYSQYYGQVAAAAAAVATTTPVYGTGAYSTTK